VGGGAITIPIRAAMGSNKSYTFRMTYSFSTLSGRIVLLILLSSLFASVAMPFSALAACVQTQSYPPQTICTDESNGTVSASPGVSSSGVGVGVGGSPPQNTSMSPVAFWKFDETSGTIVYDSSGNGYNGVLENGATRYSGTQQGNKLELDGADDRMRVETDPASRPSNEFTSAPDLLNNMNSFTLMAWVRPTENGGIILRKGNSDAARFNFGIRIDGVVYLRAGYSERTGVWQTTSTLPLNAWSHVAVTYSYGTSNKPKFYVNGVEQALRASVGNPTPYDPAEPLGSPVADTPYLFIGNNHDFVNDSQPGSDPGFEGRMDNIRIYNAVLSGDAVASARTPEPDASAYVPIPFPQSIVPSANTGNAGTVASLQAQLQALMAQIAALSGSTPGSATMPSSNAACPAIVRALVRGMRGDDVTQLQKFLIAKAMLEAGNDTGFFGARTEAAVKAWQASKGLESIGIVGPRSRAMLAICN
jgi:hypothetical protein